MARGGEVFYPCRWIYWEGLLPQWKSKLGRFVTPMEELGWLVTLRERTYSRIFYFLIIFGIGGYHCEKYIWMLLGSEALRVNGNGFFVVVRNFSLPWRQWYIRV